MLNRLGPVLQRSPVLSWRQLGAGNAERRGLRIATERRLQQMAERAMRAADLLRTRVDVDRSAQNEELLASMDKRADLQLRLQRTVEGLSVVAISRVPIWTPT